MAQATAYEQYMLELVNAERAKVGAQPLAFNSYLNSSADSHTNWMINTDTFSHTGANGSTPTARMKAAGYTFSGSWSSAENIAWASTRAPSGYQDEVTLLHKNFMNSAGHKANILNANFREVGIGFNVGSYQNWNAAFATENFARSGSKIFLTGVTMDDRDGDRFYDVGEALGGITITAVSSTGAKYTTTSQAAGGYSLALGAGTYKVTYSGGGIKTVTKSVTIGSKNVKVDLIDPAMASSATTVAKAAAPVLKTGAAASGTLSATDSAETSKTAADHAKVSFKEKAEKLLGEKHADAFQFNGKLGADKALDFRDLVSHIDQSGKGFSFGDLKIDALDSNKDGIVDHVVVKAHDHTVANINVKAALAHTSDFLL